MNSFKQFGERIKNNSQYINLADKKDTKEYDAHYYENDKAVFLAFEEFINMLQARRFGFDDQHKAYGEAFTEEGMAQLYEIIREETCKWLDTINDVRCIMKPQLNMNYTDSNGGIHVDPSPHNTSSKN